MKVGDIVEPVHKSTRFSFVDILTHGVDMEVVNMYKDKDCGLSMVSVKAVNTMSRYVTHYNYPQELLKVKENS